MAKEKRIARPYEPYLPKPPDETLQLIKNFKCEVQISRYDVDMSCYDDELASLSINMDVLTKINEAVASFKTEHPGKEISNISVIPHLSIDYYIEVENPNYKKQCKEYEKVKEIYLLEKEQYKQDLIEYKKYEKERMLILKNAEIERAKELLKKEGLL